jgi:outer membrane murein-binding lipoprotein Lpp
MMNTPKWRISALSAIETQEWNMSSAGRSAVMILAISVGGLTLSGCATEKYVNEQIATVNERINAVDAKAQDAATRADAANSAAQSANQRLDQLTPRVDALEQQAMQMQKRPRN